MIAVLGAGPHGRSIAELFPVRLYDDDPALGLPPCREAVGEPALIGAAWPSVRRAIHDRHGPVSAPMRWGPGVVRFPGARIGHDVVIGMHTHVGANAVVSHGCRIGEFVNVCPGASLGGEVEIEDDVFVGIGACVVHGGIRIGRGALIGAGAVVTRDVPPHVVVVGNPARPLRGSLPSVPPSFAGAPSGSRRRHL